jgi:hypothetical protein
MVPSDIKTHVPGVLRATTMSNQSALITVPADLESQQITIRSGLGVTGRVVSESYTVNGAVYAIDQVLAPPLSLTATAQMLGFTGFTKALEIAKVPSSALDKLANRTLYVFTHRSSTSSSHLLFLSSTLSSKSMYSS